MRNYCWPGAPVPVSGMHGAGAGALLILHNVKNPVGFAPLFCYNIVKPYGLDGAFMSFS